MVISVISFLFASSLCISSSHFLNLAYFSHSEWHRGCRSVQSLHGAINNLQRLLHTMSAAGYSAGVTHSL